MPLPEMTTPITPRALVCDRVTVYVQVHVQNLPANFLRSLRDAFGFERMVTADGEWGYWLDDFTLGNDRIPIRIQASIINRENVGFAAELSPLKALHRESRADTDEQGVIDQDNWIKAADIRADNTWAVRAVARLIPTLRPFCRDMVQHILENRIVRDMPPGQRPRIASTQITLRKIELPYDFLSGQPNITVDKFEPHIAALCPEVSHRRYPRSRYQRGVTRLGRMVEGYIHPNERIKAYVKAWPRRVRLELTLSEDRLRLHAHSRLARNRSMSVLTSNDFLRMFANLSAYAAIQFQGLITSRLRLIRDSGTAVQLYAELVNRLPDVENANRVLDKLVSHRRLLSSEGRNVIRPLLAAGVIAPSRRHTIYPIADRYREAVELIANTPGFFSHLRGLRRRA